jgi:folate-binding protein YgfZ
MLQSLPNPLHALHTQAQAEFQSYAQLEIVQSFGQPEAEYAAIRKSAALMDLPQRGLLELTGRDRLPFLNNLLTNQTWDKSAKTGIAPGTGVFAYYLNLKGRIVADMNVLEQDESTLLETDARMIEPLQKAFEKFIFSEQVKLSSLIDQFHRITLHGLESAAILNDAAGKALPLLAPLQSIQTELFSIPVTLFRDDDCWVPGHHLIVPTSRAAELWTKLLNQFASPLELGKRRLRPVGWAAFNACRIESGRPLFDIDYGNSINPDQSVLPAETGEAFTRAVSVTKGCYLGQEIVARMHARQQLAKKLVGLRISDDALPVAGASLFDENQNQIGMITSSTISPILSGASIALGYLKKPFFNEGTTVTVPAEGAMHKATVTALPFLTTDRFDSSSEI